MEILSVRDVIPPGERVVVAISGGRDSKALLHILDQLNAWDLVLAHVNHGLRPEAWADQVFVTALARKYGKDLEVLETDVKAYAKERKMSLEEAGREIRYRFFLKVARKHNSIYVVTAHTKDDQAETVLGNFVRGSFLDGLGGMEELAILAPPTTGKTVFLYRPFLNVSRKLIDSYIKYHKLAYVEDKSNADTRFRRNYLRHKIIPALQKINPQVAKNLAENAELYRDLNDYMVDEAYSWLGKEGEEFAVVAFNQEHIALRREIVRQLLLGFWIPRAKVSAKRVQECIAFLTQAKTGTCFPLNQQYQLCLEYGNLRVRSVSSGKRMAPRKSKRFELNLNGETAIGRKRLIIKKQPSREISIEKGKHLSKLRAFIDGGKIVGKKLYLRFWKPGDRFTPLGMQGKKKLQDFFVDLKVSRRDRNKIPLIVTEEDEIVWVVGYRLDDRFKLVAKSKEVLEISWDSR